MLLLSVDPGIRGCGHALFEDGDLRAAGYSRNPRKKGNDLGAIVSMALEIAEGFNVGNPDLALVVEWPQVYREKYWKGDPNDLTPLAGVVSAVAGILRPGILHRYLPREWKGTIDPEEISRRVRARMMREEFDRIVLPMNTCASCLDKHSISNCLKTSCLAHNVYDAIGIGLKHLGRFEPVKVFPR